MLFVPLRLLCVFAQFCIRLGSVSNCYTGICIDTRGQVPFARFVRGKRWQVELTASVDRKRTAPPSFHRFFALRSVEQLGTRFRVQRVNFRLWEKRIWDGMSGTFKQRVVAFGRVETRFGDERKT